MQKKKIFLENLLPRSEPKASNSIDCSEHILKSTNLMRIIRKKKINKSRYFESIQPKGIWNLVNHSS